MSGRRAYPRRRRSPLVPILLILVALGLIVWGIVWLAGDVSGHVEPPVVDDPVVDDPVQDDPVTPDDETQDGDDEEEPEVPQEPYIDESGMLQFSTVGRYVQRDSYQGGGEPDWKLLLVNDWNPMPAGYDEDLSFTDVGNNNDFDSRAADALLQMMAAGSAYDIQAVSGYRSAATQDYLYWRKVQQYRDAGYSEYDAQLTGGTVVKRPGYSEHNCGLAIDLGGSGDYSLETTFENTEAFAWLIEHCADYGFILRFPEGKEDVTGVIYEPWHYRYVGTEAARYIMENDLCLEEYLELMKK